jgi:sulfite reductase (NADPH) flavoprotein alpha-component
MSTNIPFIPSSAPFSPEQRAWLNGYFVGLLSTAHPPEQAAAESKPLGAGCTD